MSFSLCYLREIGLDKHAALNEAHLEEESNSCPRHLALSHSGRPHPEGYYGACFLLGRDLIAVTGWGGLVDMNRARNAEARPEPDRWITGLEDEAREQVEKILAG